MFGTTVTQVELLESLSKPLKSKLRAIGVNFCNSELTNFIKTNLDYALDYCPTAFSYFKLYSDHLEDLSDLTDKPAVGHRVTYTDHNGRSYSGALIVSIIGSKVKVSEVSSHPTLSLVGNRNEIQKVVISSDEKDNTRVIDICRFNVKDKYNSTYIFKTNPLIEDSAIKISSNMLRWHIV